MPWPPSPLPTDANDGRDSTTGAQDGPTSVGYHAGLHNDTNAAVNELVQHTESYARMFLLMGA